jgi:hypothetical protein
MGPLFVIVLWLIAAGIFGILWVGSLVAFLVGKRKRKRLLKWLGLMPLTGLTLLALLIACVFAVGIIRAVTPKYVFADAFGEKPSADIVNIRSKAWSFADSADVFLQFQTTPETFHRLIPKELKRFNGNSRHGSIDHDWPTWWRSIDPATSEVYILETDFGEGKRFATETIIMMYDPQNRIVQYHYQGID